MKIYVSHRRGDSDELQQKLYAELSRRFGAQNVLFENDTIPAGTIFRNYLAKRVSSADVMLVLMGERWLGDKPPGRRPLNNPLDLIRIELETALHCNLPCISVLLGGKAQPPTAEDLPRALRNFATGSAQVVRIDGESPAKLDLLTNLLESLPTPPRKKPPLHPLPLLAKGMRRTWIAVALTGIFLAVFFAWSNFYGPAEKNRRGPGTTEVNAGDATNVELDQNLITPTPASEP